MAARASVTLGLCAVAAACGAEPTAGPDAGRPLAIAGVEDLGRFAEPSAIVVGRDGGLGGRLGDRLLWTFGDSFLTAANPVDGSNVLSATAGWSSLDAPLALTQPVDGAGFPAQFIPYTAAELTQNRAAPLDGWALWPGMMIDTGAAEGLVVFQRVKRTAGSGFDGVAVGTAWVAVDAPVARRDPDDLFTRPEPLFFPQVVVDGMAYAIACDPIGSLNVGCKLARAAVADAGRRAAYQFYDGGAWQADLGRAAVVLEGVGGVPTISWNPWLGRYLAVSGRLLDSAVQLRAAARVEGPWSAPVEVAASADGASGIFAPLDPAAFDYGAAEHVALRSADGRAIVISYSRPTEPFRGDVRLARITLQ